MEHRLNQFYCFSFAAKPPPPPRKCVIIFLIILRLTIILWVLVTHLIILILLWPSRWTLVWVLDNLNYHNFPPQLVGAHGQNGVRAWRLVARVSAWDHVNAWLGLTAGDPVPRQKNARFRIVHVSIKTASIRKLSNFNFQWTKTLYQNNLKHIAFFFTFLKDYRCNLLSVITRKKISYGNSRK